MYDFISGGRYEVVGNFIAEAIGKALRNEEAIAFGNLEDRQTQTAEEKGLHAKMAAAAITVLKDEIAKAKAEAIVQKLFLQETMLQQLKKG